MKPMFVCFLFFVVKILGISNDQILELVSSVDKAHQKIKIKTQFAKTLIQKSHALENQGLMEFTESELDYLAYTFCRNEKKAHMVMIWPKALHHFDEIKEELAKCAEIIHIKKANLNRKAQSYLLKEIPEKSTAVSKHLEYYFSNKSKGKVIAILCRFPSLAVATSCKKKIRNKLNITPKIAALHIADDQPQSIALCQIFFNFNSLNYINNQMPSIYFPKFRFLFEKYQNYIKKLRNSNEYFCVDGSSILAMHGIRDLNVDFDYLSAYKDIKAPKQAKYKFGAKRVGPLDLHNQAWIRSGVDPIEAIINPKYHFFYKGYKFVTLDHIRYFKYRQNRPVDQRDVKAIDKAKFHSLLSVDVS